jgi:hypothetical protein
MAGVLMLVFSCMTVSVHADTGLRFDDWYGAVFEGSMRFSEYGDAEIRLFPRHKGDKEQWIRSAYRIQYENRIPFLRFGENLQEKWLLLHSEYFIFAYKSEKEEVFAACSEGGQRFHYIHGLKGPLASATSFLTEGDTRYTVDNLATYAPSHPWVEGVEGPGIGERINFKTETPYGGGMRILIFSNGYVSYDKPYLYEKNARVKRLRVTNSLEEFDFEIDVEDTPNPQLIFLPVATADVELEILEVFPGTQWEDTCVNFIWVVRQLMSSYFMSE